MSLFLFDFKFTLIYLLKLSFTFIVHFRDLLKCKFEVHLVAPYHNQVDIRWGVTVKDKLKFG